MAHGVAGGRARPDADGTLRVAGKDGRPHGGSYTQDDIREIVAYAADRFVTVVPEIETPGTSAPRWPRTRSSACTRTDSSTCGPSGASRTTS